jgi:serine/threonine-protein kinase
MGLAATVSSLALSIQYFEEHKKALELQRSLAERLELLEARTKEVNGLNVELRRQLSANATELASALVKASRSGLGKQLETGDIVDGRYRVGRHLGTGGMGTVFEVQRVSDEKRFAMKVITGKHSSVAVARLAREAENALRVECPSVVGLRDVGTTEDNVLFLVMDLVEGPCLAEEKARFGDTNWCVEVLRQIAEGLAAIHKAGVVHRDIKPRNVLLSYADDPLWPKARIADFGLAAALASDGDESGTADSRGQGLTRTGHVVGTPLYMAPEAHGPSQMVGAPSDIFSLGVLAREILKLETSCFAVPLGMMLAVQHTNEVTPIRKARPELDPVLAEVLDACLALDPSQRPSADQVFQACQGIVPPGSSRGVLGSQSQCA